MLSIRRRPAALLLALGAAACLGETTLVTPPKPPATTVTLTFTAGSEHLATATALGWASGIPDVAVTVTPQDSSSPPQQFQGSVAGDVTLDQLAGGKYVVDGFRWPTDAERAQLPAGDDAVGFVTKVYLNTAAVGAEVAGQMVASRRHGLVISAWKDDPLFTTKEGTYFYSGYLRLYNNGDTTIYLDGLLVGAGRARLFDYAGLRVRLLCALHAGSRRRLGRRDLPVAGRGQRLSTASRQHGRAGHRRHRPPAVVLRGTGSA
jgi:hypothetical protein